MTHTPFSGAYNYSVNHKSGSAEIAEYIRQRSDDVAETVVYMPPLGPLKNDVWGDFHRRNRPLWKKILGLK